MVFTIDDTFDAKAKMKVFGVGGAGGNAVNRMVDAGLTGVEFVSINTDAMALDNNRAPHRLQIGERITKGLGAGANPDIGKIAMEEDRDRIAQILEGADMVFITAGMGGGTGTGGAPVVAEIARSMDILTVAIVTKPFLFEGKVRDRNAKKGIDDLRRNVDTIIVIPNQKLLSIVDRATPLIDAFKTADDVLYQATKGISDLITVHGLVNLDFADVRTIMKGMGDALMGTGYGEGEDRAVNAADAAIHSPLLDDISINGARGILINITGGEDMTLYDVSDATQSIYDAVGEGAETNIIFGAVNDPTMNGKIRVTVIATGFNEESVKKSSDKAPAMAVCSDFKVLGAKDRADNRVEQLSIGLNAPQAPVKPEQVVAEVCGERKNTVILNRADVTPPSAEAVAAESGDKHPWTELRAGPAIEIHPMIKKEAAQREAQVFVSKGRVITHYEDDMDVPTFLRKQMQ